MFAVQLLPDGQVLQTFGIVNIVDQQTKVGVLEIAGDQTSKALLSSRVPQLQTIVFVLRSQVPDQEINANGSLHNSRLTS